MSLHRFHKRNYQMTNTQMHPHSHPAHRNITEQDNSDVPPLLNALRDCVTELMTFADDASCDHSVGVCWCSFHRALDNAKKLIACHERSDRFIADLES
jgi:hypothetical protein